MDCDRLEDKMRTAAANAGDSYRLTAAQKLSMALNVCKVAKDTYGVVSGSI